MRKEVMLASLCISFLVGCGSLNAVDLTGLSQLQGIPLPVVLQPDPLVFTGNNPNLIISGTCDDGYNVILGGDIDASEVLGNSLIVACSSSMFTFDVQKVLDGTYSITVSQQDGQGNSSNPVTIGWTLAQ